MTPLLYLYDFSTPDSLPPLYGKGEGPGAHNGATEPPFAYRGGAGPGTGTTRKQGFADQGGMIYAEHLPLRQLLPIGISIT